MQNLLTDLIQSKSALNEKPVRVNYGQFWLHRSAPLKIIFSTSDIVPKIQTSQTTQDTFKSVNFCLSMIFPVHNARYKLQMMHMQAVTE